MFDQLIAQHDVDALSRQSANVVFAEFGKEEIVVLDDAEIVRPRVLVFEKHLSMFFEAKFCTKFLV